MYAVLQVTPALEAGGVERTTIEVAEALARVGARALVASAGGRLEGELELVGGEVHHLPVDTKNPFRIVKNAGLLAALAQREGVQIIHARSRAPGWSALWAARRRRLPFVTTYHGVYTGKTALKRFYNSVMARGDLVIANSDFTRAHIIAVHKIDPDRVVSIPRGADLQRFSRRNVSHARVLARRRAWGVDERDERILILMPTRVTRWKGHEVMIDAAEIAMRTHAGKFLVIMAGSASGRESFHASLLARIAERGLDQHVRLTGHEEDMPAALLACDVAATPSIEPEAFGRSAVEAMAMERPVIASRLGGFLETIVEGRTGLLVPPGDGAALAAAMTGLIDADPAGRAAMGAAGLARVSERYSKSALQAATLQVYERLLAGRR